MVKHWILWLAMEIIKNINIIRVLPDSQRRGTELKLNRDPVTKNH